VQDTIDRAQATLDENGRLVFDGHPVSCVLVDRCTYFNAGPIVSGSAMSLDVSVTAWGLGVRGLSATALARTRRDVGGEFALPRTEDRFDLLLAYAELARERWRARAGRLRTAAGLGFSAYDGAELQLRPRGSLRVEGYAGRSLAPGLEESRDAALDPIEAFVPDQSSWLFGAALGWEPARHTGLALRYQRDLLGDRSVLLSERASFDARTTAWRPVTLEMSTDWDVALSRIGKSHIAVSYPASRALTLRASARRYLPYFELWTIWGYFSPVAYREAELDAAWAASPGLNLRGGIAWRAYEEHDASVIFDELHDDAVRMRLGGVYTGGPWTASAEYRLDRAVGAFFNGGDAEVRWLALDGLELGAHVIATQQIMEFRLGDERIWGAGASVRWQLGRRLLATAGATRYAHQVDGRPTRGDWDQTRAWVALDVGFGSEPDSLDEIVPAAPLPEDYWPATDADAADERAEVER
jgi:hypothetical protein